MVYIVYRTTNKINGKIYIGVHKTVNPDIDDGYRGSGRALKAAIRKHGEENFIRETLTEFGSMQEALERECKMVDDDFMSRSDTYNMKCGGRGGWLHTDEIHEKSAAGHRGKHHSGEHRKKISDAERGKTHSVESKKKMSEAVSERYNGVNGEEARALMAARQMGHLVSDETKKKLSEAGKRRTTSESTRRKISESLKGRVVSNETRKKISKAISGEHHHLYGKKRTPEERDKISSSLMKLYNGPQGEEYRAKVSGMKGKKHSEETRIKMSESMKLHWQRTSKSGN